MIARGRGFGLPDDEEIPEDHGNLIPRDVRLMARIARRRQTVFLLTKALNKLYVLIYHKIIVRICLIFTLVKRVSLRMPSSDQRQFRYDANKCDW